MKNKQKTLLLYTILFFAHVSSADTTTRDIPRSKRSGLMILNFNNATPKSRSEEFSPWEFGLPSMIMTDMEIFGLFNIISRERMKDIMAEHALQLSGIVKTDDIVKTGQMAGARYILSGSFTEMNGTLKIEAQVFSVEQCIQIGSASITGLTERYFDLEKKIVIKIAQIFQAQLSKEDEIRFEKNIETRSFMASLFNYRGEIAVNTAGDLKKKGMREEAKRQLSFAVKCFKESLDFDPNYKKAIKNFEDVCMTVPVVF